MSHSLEKIYKLIEKGNSELKQEIREFKDSFSIEIQDIKVGNEKLELENDEIKKRLLETERKLKKYSFVKYGIGSNEENTTQRFIEIVNETLNIECEEGDFRDIYILHT